MGFYSYALNTVHNATDEVVEKSEAISCSLFGLRSTRLLKALDVSAGLLIYEHCLVYMTGVLKTSVVSLVLIEISTILAISVNMKEAFVPHLQLVLAQASRTTVD